MQGSLAPPLDPFARWRWIQDRGVLYQDVARDGAESHWSGDGEATRYVERRVRSDSFEWEIARVEEYLPSGGTLLEIGPGGGAMTRRLARRAGQITAAS